MNKRHRCPALKVGDRITVTTCYQFSPNTSRWARVIAVYEHEDPSLPTSYAIQNEDTGCCEYVSDSWYYRLIVRIKQTGPVEVVYDHTTCASRAGQSIYPDERTPDVRPAA